MNMKTKLTVVSLVVCFGLVAHAFAAMGDLKEPGLGFPDSFPAAARTKIMAALRRPDCKFLSGTSHNAGTRLRYAGETVPLNLFLESLAGCPGITVSIRFHNELGDGISDWVVDQDGFDPTRLCVRVNLKSSRVKIENLVVPEIKAPSITEKK